MSQPPPPDEGRRGGAAAEPAAPVAADLDPLLVETIPQMVWIAAPDGSHVRHNARWREYTGLDEATSRGDGWQVLLHPEDRDRVAEHWRRASRAGEVAEVECRLRGRDGKYRWFLSRAAPHRPGGEAGAVAGWFGTWTDIDDQKRAHEHLRRVKEESEALNRVKDEFIATLSHELRTPLSAILGWTQLIRGDMLEPGEMPEALAKIEHNAKVQATLVEDMLDVGRILNNRLRLALRPVQVPVAVRAAVGAIQPAAREKRIAVEESYQDRPLWVSADPGRLQQVVTNLLNNAVKFTPAGGRVTVAVDEVQSCVRLRVTDTGRGISPDLIPTIFDRFTQGRETTAERKGGLGLGLAIVKHLLDLHGATVQVESPGTDAGTTFTVLLPLLAVREGQRPLAPRVEVVEPPAPGALRGLRILVLDDEECARDLIATTLRKLGADVVVCHDVADAEARVTSVRPDVALSDIAMPLGDGFEFVRRVRGLTDPGLASTPIIALTGYASIEDRTRATEAGFDGHIAKPADAATLVAGISGALRGILPAAGATTA